MKLKTYTRKTRHAVQHFLNMGRPKAPDC